MEAVNTEILKGILILMCLCAGLLYSIIEEDRKEKQKAKDLHNKPFNRNLNHEPRN
jgi:hypothetical protein